MLISIKRRPDSRPTPRKEKEPLPKWAIVANRDGTLPVWMYLAPNLEDYEAAITNNKELKFKKIRVKGCQPTDVQMARINL